jgi:secreted PhoX family phosphatase
VVPRLNLNLVKDPKGICDLPKGFNYKIISQVGDKISDGLLVPDKHDGMGCFEGPLGEIILVRNHEIAEYLFSDPESPLPKFAYDPKSSGGCTTIWLNNQLEVTKQYMSLTGTILNCSGGKTPWGTWISCEEADEGFGTGWEMGKRHGYAFEVDPLKPIQKAQPLKSMGTFRREGIAVDSKSGIVYQTEDSSRGSFYRFIPTEKSRLNIGGVLQALKFEDAFITHTTNNQLQLNKSYPCHWVVIEEPDPDKNTVAIQAQKKGAAVFVRSEGIVAQDGGIFFTCTTGGDLGLGQIFKYTPNPDNNTGNIQLVFEASERGVLEKPDNITINQWGDLIICEDNRLDQQCLIGLTPEGKLYYIAANAQSEWAGSCFSPDGKTLFANIFRDKAMTLAIQGPWEQLRKEV